MKNLEIQVTQKQKRFIDAAADEVLFGGAAGGGKSYGQIVDALLYALKVPKKQAADFAPDVSRAGEIPGAGVAGVIPQ